MQITTETSIPGVYCYCCLYHKDTKLNANHNSVIEKQIKQVTVAYITKILN